MPSLGTMRHARVSLLFNDETSRLPSCGETLISFWLRKRDELFPRVGLEDHLHTYIVSSQELDVHRM